MEEAVKEGAGLVALAGGIGCLWLVFVVLLYGGVAAAIIFGIVKALQFTGIIP